VIFILNCLIIDFNKVFDLPRLHTLYSGSNMVKVLLASHRVILCNNEPVIID